MLFSCNPAGVYEQTAAFKNQSWAANQPLNFACEIKDSTKAYYNIFFVIRHTEKYHYNNIWLNITATADGKTVLDEKAKELQLTNNERWLGTSMGDIIEQRISLTPNPVLLKKGTYQFTIEQIMREDPLQNVLNAGVRVEKVVQ